MPLQMEEREHRLKEVSWNLQQRVRQELAYPAIMHFFAWLLQGAALRFLLSILSHGYDQRAEENAAADYASNGRFVNHCLVAFFRRIADPSGINLEPMLYQVQGQSCSLTSFSLIGSYACFGLL